MAHGQDFFQEDPKITANATFGLGVDGTNITDLANRGFANKDFAAAEAGSAPGKNPTIAEAPRPPGATVFNPTAFDFSNLNTQIDDPFLLFSRGRNALLDRNTGRSVNTPLKGDNFFDAGSRVEGFAVNPVENTKKFMERFKRPVELSSLVESGEISAAEALMDRTPPSKDPKFGEGRPSKDPKFGEGRPKGDPGGQGKDAGDDFETGSPGGQGIDPGEIEKNRDEAFNLGGAAAEKLRKFITGETPDRLARQTRDNFNRFVSSQTDALQADILNQVQSGQLSGAQAIAAQQAQFNNFARIGSRLENQINQNKEDTIRESIEDVSQFLESQVRIDRTNNLIEKTEFDKFISATTAGILDPNTARLGISKVFPSLLSKGMLNEDGSIKDEFKSPSGVQLMKDELDEAGFSEAEINSLVKIAVGLSGVMATSLLNSSQIQNVVDGGNPDTAFAIMSEFDNSLTRETFDNMVESARGKKEVADVEADIEGALSNPFGKTADELMANPDVSTEDKDQILDMQVKFILRGESLDELNGKIGGDPLYDAVLKKSTKVTFASKRIERRGRSPDVQVFTFDTRVGKVISIGGVLYEITSLTQVLPVTAGTDDSTFNVVNLSSGKAGFIKASNPTNVK